LSESIKKLHSITVFSICKFCLKDYIVGVCYQRRNGVFVRIENGELYDIIP